MNAALPAGSSATPLAGESALAATPSYDDDDVAIGCECANPLLQIDAWHSERAAEPSAGFY